MKRKIHLIGLCVILVFISFFAISKTPKPVAKPAVSQPKVFNAETAMLAMFNDYKTDSSNRRKPLDSRTVLRFALNKHGLDLSNWKEKGEILSAIETEDADHDGRTIHMNEAISIVNSGFSPDGNVYAALIEKANEANDPDYFVEMELNSYTCDLLVLRKAYGKWKVDFFGQVDESQYGGGSRGARSCGDGYRLAWKNGRPAFVDKYITTGPYSGGYSKAVMSIGWIDGKYQLDGIILYEGFLDGEKLEANFSSGKYGEKGYEHFSFRTEGDDKPGKIFYSYGEQGKDIKLSYLGTDTLNGELCFKVRFPNKFILYVIPKENYLEVVSVDGKYSKKFQWGDNRSANELETDCEGCLGEIQALALVRVYFLK